MKQIIILSIVSFCLFSQTELKAQFKLQLVKIKCIDSEDRNDDETYIMVNDNKVWNGGEQNDMESGEERSLLSVAPISFNCPISVRIYDKEDVGSDDYCGRHVINVTPPDYREFGREKIQELHRVDEDCRYSITYKILLDN